MAGTNWTYIDSHVLWLEYRNLRPTYLRALRQTLERLAREQGDLLALTEEQLQAWWRHLDVSSGTRVTYLAHVSSFYRWAVRERLRIDDPTIRIPRPKLRRRLPRPIHDDALAMALDAATPPVSTWLMLSALQGLRACEIATLHREDVRDGLLVVREGKGGKQRILPLHPEIASELVGLPRSGPLFRDRSGAQIRVNTITARVNRFLHAVGVAETMHQCRHRFITQIYAESKDLRLTQELAGHEDPKTTAGYAAWDQSNASGFVAAVTLPA